MNIIPLPVAKGSITIALFTSPIGALVGLATSFITTFCYVMDLLNYFWVNWRVKEINIKMEILAKSKLNIFKSIVLKAMQQCYQCYISE